MGVMTIVAVVVMELHKMKNTQLTQITQISGKQTVTEKAKIFGGKKNEDKLN